MVDNLQYHSRLVLDVDLIVAEIVAANSGIGHAIWSACAAS